MKRLAVAIMAGGLWLTVSMFGQAAAPGASAAPAANTTCPCGKVCDGNCGGGGCGRGMSAGRMQGRWAGRGRMMGMRGGGMGQGGGACMRMRGQAPAAQPETAPKIEKK